MRDSFFGLNVALRGLYTAHRNLDVINHNINNVNTPGFSRQQAVQAAARPLPVYDGTGMIGTGSDVISINRVRDEYLDFKYWSENVSHGEWKVKSELLSDLEVTFNEPSDSGFTVILGEFFSSLQELAKDPSSSAVRALVREKGVTVAKYFNSTAAHLEKLQADINYRINTKVGEVNSLATQIQQLNRQIYIAELDGNSANDLRDRRTLLVDKMSGIINLEANEIVTGKLPDGRDDKHFVITISGKGIIDHFNISKLAVVQRDDSQKLNEEDLPDLYEVQWEDGNKLNITGGELRGYLDIRDGNEGKAGLDGTTYSPMYNGIPYYIGKLNQFVRTFAMAFNEGYLDSNTNNIIEPGEDGIGHADGYRLDSVEGDPPSGVRFFTMLGDDKENMSSEAFIDGATTIAEICSRYEKITAKNFAISNEILTDLNSISTSDAAGEAGNINSLNEIIKMRHNPHMFSEGAPEDFMKSLVAALGIDSQQAVRYSANQKAIVNQIENRRLSDSGVSINEEMANMVKFQHAYNAAARMIVTMSEVYDILINRLGL
jgi:flagellar hook-associated protein 1 FlgK